MVHAVVLGHSWVIGLAERAALLMRQYRANELGETDECAEHSALDVGDESEDPSLCEAGARCVLQNTSRLTARSVSFRAHACGCYLLYPSSDCENAYNFVCSLYRMIRNLDPKLNQQDARALLVGPLALVCTRPCLCL